MELKSHQSINKTYLFINHAIVNTILVEVLIVILILRIKYIINLLIRVHDCEF